MPWRGEGVERDMPWRGGGDGMTMTMTLAHSCPAAKVLPPRRPAVAPAGTRAQVS